MAQIWRQEMGKAMRKAASMCKPVLIARTVDAPPAKPGAIAPKGAIDQRAIIDGWEFIFTPGSLEVMIYNRADHGAYADQGVPSTSGKIGGPVAQSLFESWMIRKGIQISENKGNGRVVIMSNKRAAKFLIFKINSRAGAWRFQPRKFVERSQARIQEIFNREIAAQRDRMIAKAIASAATKGRV